MNGAQRADGGPAFPYAFHFPEQDGEPSGFAPGMTLRDHFAAMALTSVATLMAGGMHQVHGADGMAQTAYQLADAMLAERAKKGGAA